MALAEKQAEPASPPPPAESSEVVFGEVLTLPEAAAYLRLSEADVLRFVNEQDLPARQIGREWRFLTEAIQDWLSTPPPKSKPFHGPEPQPDIVRE